MRALLTLCSMLVLAALGCGDDSGGAGMGGAGGLTPIGGAGGLTGGAGGTTGGTMPTGGTGGIAGMAGTGVTGGMGGSTTTPDCAMFEAMAPGTARGTHEVVAGILRGDGTPTNMMGSCAFSSCHSSANKATLDFTAMPMDITTALVNVPACEAQGMVRVKPGDPLNSWLWIKLVGPYDAEGNITYPATPQNCSGATPGTVGILMPYSPGAPTLLDPVKLFQICSWITDGAPGPM